VDVISGFDVGPEENQYRIGLIKYSSTSIREFDLNTYQTKTDVLNAVMRMTYPGGGTATHLALDMMVTQSFTTVNGARDKDKGHPHVGIVITDGQSNAQLTREAALRAHAAEITMFSVGVGTGVNLAELDVIASTPTCLYRFLLAGFTDFDGLRESIEKRTCEAPIIMSPGSNSTTVIRPGENQNCKLRITAAGMTVEMTSSQGKATFYTSKTTYPSSEYYETKMEATPNRMGFIYIPQPPTSQLEGIVFCNIKGDNYTDSNVSIGTSPGENDGCKNVTCQNSGSCINTPNGGYECECQPGYTGQDCESRVECPLEFAFSASARKCYKVITQPLTWNDAKEECSRLATGATLAVVETKTQDTAISDYIKSVQQEMQSCSRTPGYMHLLTSGQLQIPNVCGSYYVWKPKATGSTPVSFTNWYEAEPSCSFNDDHCLYYHNRDLINYRWIDDNCNTPSCSICEIKANV